MQFEIESNVPIPATNKGGREATYPFGKLEDGQSFAVTTDEAGIRKVQRAAAAYARRNGVKLVTRRIETGVRVWRSA